jgi:hypothetical protein
LKLVLSILGGLTLVTDGAGVFYLDDVSGVVAFRVPTNQFIASNSPTNYILPLAIGVGGGGGLLILLVAIIISMAVVSRRRRVMEGGNFVEKEEGGVKKATLDISTSDRDLELSVHDKQESKSEQKDETKDSEGNIQNPIHFFR